jgi:pyruvate/2-oxoglutarate dehydrogenase complex dihydrolipoamide dehydrogenase (E3) component
MASVQRRKRIMVEGLHQLHVDREAASGGELIIGNARFVAPRTVEVALNDGGTRTIFADRVILALGSRATMPNIPGLSAAQPMTHVETCMMDVEAHHESSITDTMAKILTIVSRRNFDGKPKVYS